MTAAVTKIRIWSNNSFLEESFKVQASADTNFVELHTFTHVGYLLLIVDLSQNLSNISQKIIEFYHHAREKDQKLAVLVLHNRYIEVEKNIYFEDLLNKIGGNKPIHRLVILKDLFQPNTLSFDTYLEKYILDAIGNRKITISSKGENIYFPISFSDLVHSLKKIFFLNGTSGKTFWILGDPISDLEIAYLIKKSLEDTEGVEFEIESTGENLKTSVDINSLGNQSRAQLNWEPQEDFSDALKEAARQLASDRSILLTRLHHASEKNKHPKVEKIRLFFESIGIFIRKIVPKKGTRKKIESGSELIKKVFEYTVTAACLIYLAISLTFIGFTALSLKSLEKTLTHLRRGDVQLSVKELKTSKLHLGIGESSYSFVSPIIALIAPDFHNKNYNLFIFLHYSQTSLNNLQQTYQLSENIYQTIGDSNPKQFYSDSSLALKSNLVQLYENISQIELLTGTDKLPKVLEDKLKSSSEFKNLRVIASQISELLKSIELIPAMLAGDSVKNIIVLFQTSLEVRPTGGAIDYVLSVVIDNGKIISRKIYRSDEIDALSVGVVTAPPLIRLYSGVEDWKTRDLNFNPDFPQTASNVSWFIEKNLKFKPDVILAVSENLMLNLLAETKGVLLNGQNISSDTLSQEMFKTSPSPLYIQLIDHFLDQIITHQLPLISLGRVIANQSETNQILFWASDETTEKTIVSLPFSGYIYPHSCFNGISNSKKCVAETTYLNESNFSLVPLGAKLQRKVKHFIWLEADSTKHEYQIEYKFSENIPDQNKDLSMILQLYSPLGSKIQRVSVDEKDVLLTDIENQQDNQLERFQIPISIAFNKSHNVVIQFSTPVRQRNLIPFAYSITEYQQTGLNIKDSELTIYYPESARPSLITAPVVTGQNSLNLVLPPKTYTFGVNLTFSNQ